MSSLVVLAFEALDGAEEMKESGSVRSETTVSSVGSPRRESRSRTRLVGRWTMYVDVNCSWRLLSSLCTHVVRTHSRARRTNCLPRGRPRSARATVSPLLCRLLVADWRSRHYVANAQIAPLDVPLRPTISNSKSYSERSRSRTPAVKAV